MSYLPRQVFRLVLSAPMLQTGFVPENKYII